MNALRRWWQAAVEFGMRPVEFRLGHRFTTIEQQVFALAEGHANTEALMLGAVRALAAAHVQHAMLAEDALGRLMDQMGAVLSRLATQEDLTAQLDGRIKHAVVMLTGKTAAEIQGAHGAREPRTFTHAGRQ